MLSCLKNLAGRNPSLGYSPVLFRNGVESERPIASNIGMNEFILLVVGGGNVESSEEGVTYSQVKCNYYSVSRYSIYFVLRNYKFMTMFLWKQVIAVTYF
jgi:hypothetical protein